MTSGISAPPASIVRLRGGRPFVNYLRQIAMMDPETGELIERRLEHESGEARAFYAAQLSPGVAHLCTFRKGGNH